ncbi:alcohol dehydrogenase catalytic domain-containing protein [Myxococcus sp. 1LA]
MAFRALLATKADQATSTNVVDFDEQALMPGNVTVAVEYSTVNYKDAAAVTGLGPVIHRFQFIPGIDVTDVVEASTHPGFSVDDCVVANGWGLSQPHHGGLAQRARVNGGWLGRAPTFRRLCSPSFFAT